MYTCKCNWLSKTHHNCYYLLWATQIHSKAGIFMNTKISLNEISCHKPFNISTVAPTRVVYIQNLREEEPCHGHLRISAHYCYNRLDFYNLVAEV